MKRTMPTALVAVLLSGCGLTVTRTAGSSGTASTNPATTTTSAANTSSSTTNESTTGSSETTETTETTAATTSTTEAPAGVGTRENPVPLGTTADVGDGWTMTVNSVNLDAADVIMEENSYIDPPPEGKRYVLINVTTAYNGKDESSYGIRLEVLGSATNKPISTWDATDLLSPPDPRYTGGELFQGGTETGNEAFEVSNEDADTLVIIADPNYGIGSNRTFFATK